MSGAHKNDTWYTLQTLSLCFTPCRLQFSQSLLGPLLNKNALNRPISSEDDKAGGVARVCNVLVVDDGSSLEDRRVMMSAFPSFTYVFKGEGDERGTKMCVPCFP